MEDWFSEAGYKKNDGKFVYSNNNVVELNKRIKWTVEKLTSQFGSEQVDVCEPVKNFYNSISTNANLYKNILSLGTQIKQKNENNPNISSNFIRTLMDYQKKSVDHMIQVGNAANFSVPGSGKTTIAYAAISRWMEDGLVEKIFVIGPTSSFLPWEEEYEMCYNKTPRTCRISGNLAREFHKLGDSYDLFLTHFNTAMKRILEICQFMQKWKTVLIIDESHNIKSPELRRWASTALEIAPYAQRRIILSGTPMPNDAKDLWNQITFLWPHNLPLGNQMIYNNYVNKQQGIGQFRTIIDSLFCRIKKSDLNLPKPEWIPHVVPLNTRQKEIYNIIAAKTLKEIQDMQFTEQAKLQKFRIARMIRLLQTASNPTLLYEKSREFDVNSETFSEEFGLPPDKLKLLEIEPTIYDKIVNYSKYEIPSKMVLAAQLSRDLFEKGNKVIIWCSFIHNMAIFKSQLLKEFDPIIINGSTPTEPSEPDNRDELIHEFKNSVEPKVLITTAASLGESVSLHKNLKGEKVSNHAIYLDRNFNAGQYMQSMDRIHRISMDPSVNVEYHLIIAKDTIDEVVHRRLNEKWADMLDALNDDMLRSLDINPNPEKLDATEFNKDYQAMVDHLRRFYGN